MPPTFGEDLYGITREDELFATPLGQSMPLIDLPEPQVEEGVSYPFMLSSAPSATMEDYSSVSDGLFTPIGGYGATEKQGTFATPTFDLDFAEDPYSQFVRDQIRESEDLTKTYNDQMESISDKRMGLINAAETDWSSLGAALFGAAGALAAGGNAGDIAGGAAATGMTHYNNLESQTKEKQAILEKEYNTSLANVKAEQNRSRSLQNVSAAHNARLDSLKQQGKLIGTDENKQLTASKAKPINEDYAKSVQASQIEKPVLEAINRFPATVKPLFKNASDYAAKKETGMPLTKVDTGYQTFLAGINKIEQANRNGSQRTPADDILYQEGQTMMAEGRKNLAEVGQAITDSEWTRFISPYLEQEGIREAAGPFFSWGKYTDQILRSTDGKMKIAGLKNGMEDARARLFLSKGALIPGYDYRRLKQDDLGAMNPDELSAQAAFAPNFQGAFKQWFPDSPFNQGGSLTYEVPQGALPVEPPSSPATSKFTREQIEAKKEELRKARGIGK